MNLNKIQETIIGDNIILRQITMKDTDNIVRWRNNPEVWKNFIYRGEFTYKIHKHWMETKVATGGGDSIYYYNKSGYETGGISLF